MLGNIVNRHDFVRLMRKLSRRQATSVTGKLRIRGMDRVVTHWSAAINLPSHQWWDIPAVRTRWNIFASGDPTVSFSEYVARKWLSGRSGLRALSVGSGTGQREIDWARTGAFSEIVGVDVSTAAVRTAIERAAVAEVNDVLSFRVADVRDILDSGERYDAILGLHSLHHFDHIHETMQALAQLLTPDGLLIFDEYVGPSKFQWTRSQMRVANSLLTSLPADRRIGIDGKVKNRVYRPSLLWMRLHDPSEAVESGELLSALHHSFKVLEERPYGGTLLHIALSGIAQNFMGDDPETMRLLNQCFAAEDEALPELGNDFTFAVCAPLLHLETNVSGTSRGA